MYFTFIKYFLLIVVPLVKKEPFVHSTAKVIQLHLTVKRDKKKRTKTMANGAEHIE